MKRRACISPVQRDKQVDMDFKYGSLKKKFTDMVGGLGERLKPCSVSETYSHNSFIHLAYNTSPMTLGNDTELLLAKNVH